MERVDMKQVMSRVGCLMVTLLLLAAPLWAKGPSGVSKTVHNLSATSPNFGFYSSNVDEVCVFCHTPHGGNPAAPLWNHDLPPNNSFTHYNSATLTLTSLPGMTISRVVNEESLLCMGCHDGSVALSHLINAPNAPTTDGLDLWVTGPSGGDEIVDLFGKPAARIGGSLADTAGSGDLSDDHPISFSYADVVNQGIYQGGARDGQLRYIGNPSLSDSALGWKGEGIRLFGSDYRVECSSCHDPHVDYDDLFSGTADTDYRPFLIRPNTGSDLCFACHNK